MTKMLEDLAVAVRACDDANGHAPLSDTELDLRVFIKRHHAAITDMAKRLEAAERDAARYRWLRSRCTDDLCVRKGIAQVTGQALNDDIDAGMQESTDRRTPEGE